MATPVAALILTALAPTSDSLWPHLIANVIPQALRDTVLLLLGVGLACGTVGVGTAWIVTQYEFIGRRQLKWLLVLPLAMPTYITA